MTNVEEAYKAYFNEIYKFCFYRLGNKENAEDITSEVFMKLTEQDLSKIENPRAWLYKVARNLIYDKYVKTPNISDSLHHDEEGEVDFEDKNTHLENYVFEKDFLERIQSELYKIDSVTADIIVMKVWDELPFSEIANITNLQEETVRKRFQRGISKLKNNLLKSKNMEPNQVPSQAAPTQGITSAETIDKKSFLPKSLKYAITFFAIFAVLGVGAYGAYTYNKIKNEDSNIADDKKENNDEDQDDDENDIVKMSECSYERDGKLITFKFDETKYSCDLSSDGTSLQISGKDVELYSGFLYEALCQDPAGCEKENIFESDYISFDIIKNINPDGSIYYNVGGSLMFNGHSISGAGVRLGTYFDEVSLSSEQKSAIIEILSELTINEINSVSDTTETIIEMVNPAIANKLVVTLKLPTSNSIASSTDMFKFKEISFETSKLALGYPYEIFPTDFTSADYVGSSTVLGEVYRIKFKKGNSEYRSYVSAGNIELEDGCTYFTDPLTSPCGVPALSFENTTTNPVSFFVASCYEPSGNYAACDEVVLSIQVEKVQK